MAYPSGVTATNILLRLELNRQTESQMKQLLLANSKTELLAIYDALIVDITADRATVAAAASVDTLTQ
jgi:hypothetical protein